MKLVKKLLPVNIYDIAKMETYLKNMAKKGLLIRKIGFFAYFERKESKEVTYRLEPLLKNEYKPNNDKVEYYRNFGWEYVCTISNAFHIYKTYEKEYIEMHTDPVMQSYTYDNLKRKFKKSSIITIILLFFGVIMLFGPIFFDKSPILFAVKYDDISYKIMIILSIIFAIKQSLGNKRKIELLTNKLSQGIEIKHQVKFKPNYSEYVFSGMIIIFSILTIYSSFFSIFNRGDMKISQYNKVIPTIMLENIEGNKMELVNESKFENNISYRYNELSNQIFEINQRGKVEGKMWNDNSGEYSPSISTEFYNLKFKFFANKFMEELMFDELDFYRYKPFLYNEIFDERFNRLVVIKQSEMQLLFGIVDKNVFYIRYHGYKEIDKNIDELYNNIVKYNDNL